MTCLPPEGIPITDPKYFSQMTVDELGYVLRSDNETPMPMLQERHQVILRTCSCLMDTVVDGFGLTSPFHS